ncbi:MAG: hypothetical protein IJU00_12990 [Selenomonas sp.]|nr:hypothetical protein [Selenomonas sp.]
MRKYLNKKKIAGLLTFSLLFSSVPAWAAEDIPAASTETAAPSFYDLNFDADSCTRETLYLHGQPVAFRAFEGCHYTAYPVADYKEQLNIYIPEAYFQKKSTGRFTAKTAPIFMPLAADGAAEGTFDAPADASNESGQPNLALLALAHGYVVAVPAAQSLTPPASERLGKAPQPILSYKAAIRYLRRNQRSLPAGDTNRIVVSGEGLSGSLALQLAASADQAIYKPYLYAMGVAGKSDSIFAAQAYEPVTGLAKDYARFGWTLPDGRPDPNSAARYAPLLDTEASLSPSVTPEQKETAAIEEKAVIEEASENHPAATSPGTGKRPSAANDKVSLSGTNRQPVSSSHDTKEYQDYLDKQAEYERIDAETQELIKMYSPKGHAAHYLRLCTAKADPPEFQDLKTAFERNDTAVTSFNEKKDPLQDAEELFDWIDAADTERDALEKQLWQLWRRQSAKLARAKHLADRAAAKWQKAQAKTN